MSDDTLVRQAHARLVQYLGYVLPDAPRNSVNIYEHEGGFSFDDLRTIMQDRDESLVRLNQAESALTQCALALRPFATWDDGGEQDADFAEAAKALAACWRVLHEIPNDQGEQQRQAVGGNAEGKVPDAAPECALKSSGSNPAAGAVSDTPETDVFMTLIDDSEVDLGMVEAKLGDMERQRDEMTARLSEQIETLRSVTGAGQHDVPIYKAQSIVIDRDQLKRELKELREAHGGAILAQRSAVERAELAETEVRNLQDALDMNRDEFLRIISSLRSYSLECDESLRQEIIGLCERSQARTTQRVPMITQRDNAERMIQRIQSALATGEEGEALLEVVKHAHFCELELARFCRVESLDAVREVLAERVRQHKKWGEQNHSMPIWLAILHEESGELSEAALHQIFGGHAAENVSKEAVQVAAVALQIVEYLQRLNSRQVPPCSDGGEHEEIMREVGQ